MKSLIFAILLALGVFLNSNSYSQESASSDSLLDVASYLSFLQFYDADSTPEKRESRNLWRQILLTSEFQLPFRNLESASEKNPLLDLSMPGSQPRWVTGRKSLVRPFAFEELREPQRNAHEIQYFQQIEKSFYSQNKRLDVLRDSLEIWKWTLSWTAREIYLANKSKKDSAKVQFHCRNADRGVSALGLLSRGQSPQDLESQLFFYGVGVGAGTLHPCSQFPKLSWGLAPLKHPRDGSFKEISITGEVSNGSAANFAKILSGTYTKQYDWVYGYDQSRMHSSVSGAVAIEWDKKRQTLRSIVNDKSKIDFKDWLDQMNSSEVKFERSLR